MRSIFIVIGALMYPAIILPSTAAAQQFNHTITVYAVMPEQRAIYLDQYGAILKIAGNTMRNIAPKVYDATNREVTMSPAIQRQYDDFLKQHGGQLEARKVYEINPLKVVNSSNQQKISFADNKSGMLSLVIK